MDNWNKHDVFGKGGGECLSPIFEVASVFLLIMVMVIPQSHHLSDPGTLCTLSHILGQQYFKDIP